MMQEARDMSLPLLIEDFKYFRFLFMDHHKWGMYARSKTFLESLKYILCLFVWIQDRILNSAPKITKHFTTALLVARFYNKFINFEYQWPFVLRDDDIHKCFISTDSYLNRIIESPQPQPHQRQHQQLNQGEVDNDDNDDNDSPLVDIRRRFSILLKTVKSCRNFTRNIKNFFTVYGTETCIINQDIWSKKDKLIPKYIYEIVGLDQPLMITTLLKKTNNKLYENMKHINILGYCKHLMNTIIFPREKVMDPSRIIPDPEQHQREEDQGPSSDSEEEDDDNEQEEEEEEQQEEQEQQRIEGNL